ncbi:polysaccharide deacetylase family protein [Halomicrobium sp. HM KBTZ05]|uniref:polysaccharide deacetylase family protein n=1 Tax=Halomicrobium sp. HM KBTZ05 TaxID=3242663 RepID=UPI00355888F2
MGSVVISVDAELGWGFHDVANYSERLAAARVGWKRLAGLCSEYEIPATWAVVGHLLLADCDGRHENHPRGPEWFRCERDRWADRPSLRYGPHLVADVAADPVGHEIGCHTFSHVLFGADDTTAATARAEIEACLDATSATDYSLRSFVFPRNSVGHRDLLAEYDFDCYRGVAPEERTPLNKLREATVGEPEPRLVTPTVDEHGLVDIPASLYLFSFEGRPRRLLTTVFEDPIVQYARRGIDAAASRDGVFHMWLHPNNLVGRPEIARMRAIFDYLDERRADLAIETMGEVAARVGRTDPPTAGHSPDGV